jgi:hypothetical protein
VRNFSKIRNSTSQQEDNKNVCTLYIVHDCTDTQNLSSEIRYLGNRRYVGICMSMKVCMYTCMAVRWVIQHFYVHNVYLIVAERYVKKRQAFFPDTQRKPRTHVSVSKPSKHFGKKVRNYFNRVNLHFRKRGRRGPEEKKSLSCAFSRGGSQPCFYCRAFKCQWNLSWKSGARIHSQVLYWLTHKVLLPLCGPPTETRVARFFLFTTNQNGKNIPTETRVARFFSGHN